MLNEMVLCEELFHTPSGVAFADFITEGHRETWPIRSKRFRTWLRRCYYHATGSAPSAAAIRSALDLLEARAQFDAPKRAVSTRVAEHAGRLYLDLADEHWRAVAIGLEGWRVLGCPPVRFRRAPGMLPVPVPERGGSIEALRSFLNLSNQNDFVLVVGCWPRCDRAVPKSADAACRRCRNRRRYSRERTRTGRKKLGRQPSHRPSDVRPPPGTTQWTCG